ncbi:MAG: SRPBCC domain-containing protein [Planctomycetales bacterium]|nr:SRPBCC domain-containing protein [bacterium]UNM08935.1 MAG: SRPBCC domain-containing protein [Planctomycetales bacterium]
MSGMEQERFEVRLAIDIRSSREKVWRALTDWQQLNGWLSDKADVDLPAGRFKLCGNRLPDSPCDGTDKFSLAGYEDGSRLELNWQFRGGNTGLSFQLSGDGDACCVELAHTDVPRRGETEVTMIEYWQWVLLALRGYCETGSRPGIFEFGAEQQTGQLEVGIDIAAERETVYNILASSDGLKGIFGGEGPEVELREGGKYSYGWGPNEGPTKVISFKPNELIHTDWYHGTDPETFITWKLSGSGGRTRLTLVHSGFPNEAQKHDYEAGWFHFLVELRELAEGNSDRKVEVLARPDGWAI